MDEAQTTIEEITDPAETARFRAARERHARNDEVFRTRRGEIYRDCRGKVVIVAGQEVHAADTADEAWRWAREQHPEDDAVLVRYIPRERGWRIYGHADPRRVV